MLRSALSRYPQYGLCWHAAGRARGRAGLITGAEYRPAVSRSLSTTSLGEEAHPQAGNRTDSSGADSLDTPKKLVRWARFGKMLKPDDVAKLLSDAQMPIDSGDSAQEDDDAEEDAIDALPSVRVRAKPRNPLHGLPDSEICYTNVALLSRFVSETGSILPRYRTGVTAKQQRKLKRAIRLSRQMNLMPFLSKLPQHYDAVP